jgi:HEAT repeat protein
VIEHCAPPEVLSDSIFVDFSNPVFFESAVDRLLAGAVKQAEWQAILGKLNDDDPDQRIEAVRLLIEMQDPAAFPAVKQRLVIERDDTVKQWIAGFFGGIRFPTPEMAREARRILEDLDANGEFLTRRAARQAIEGLRNCD